MGFGGWCAQNNDGNTDLKNWRRWNFLPCENLRERRLLEGSNQNSLENLSSTRIFGNDPKNPSSWRCCASGRQDDDIVVVTSEVVCWIVDILRQWVVLEGSILLE